MAACAAVRRRRVGGRRSPISRRVCPPRPQRVRHSAARPAAQRLAAARIATDLDAIYLSGRMDMKSRDRLLLFFVTSSPALVLDKYPTQWTNIGCVGIESWGTPRASHAAPRAAQCPSMGSKCAHIWALTDLSPSDHFARGGCCGRNAWRLRRRLADRSWKPAIGCFHASRVGCSRSWHPSPGCCHAPRLDRNRAAPPDEERQWQGDKRARGENERR